MAWKEAASLILCVAGPKLERGLQSKLTKDLKILMMKRTSTSSFMPDIFVFPGGQLDTEDFDESWLNNFSALKDVPLPISKRRIPLFEKYSNSPVSGELGFRLCALRETFEECGILLSARAPYQPVPMSSITAFGPDDWKSWRLRVKKDPLEFMKLHEELQLIPDVWSLHEWSNWLTPKTSKKRFDTAFFITFPSEIPLDIEVEENELTESKLLHPREFLLDHYSKLISLGPPQVYELHRLSTFDMAGELESFSKKRAAEGNERFIVHPVNTDKACHFLLPGDDNYPGDEDGTQDFKKCDPELSDIDDLDWKRKNLNRYIITPEKKKLLSNVASCGHHIPFNMTEPHGKL